MDWLSIVKMVVPFVLTAAGVPPIIIPLVTGGIAEAQGIKGATGAQKKAHVLNLVSAGVTGMNAAAGKVIVDPTLAVTTTSSGIDTAVGVVNIVHQAHGTPAVPTP